MLKRCLIFAMFAGCAFAEDVPVIYQRALASGVAVMGPSLGIADEAIITVDYRVGGRHASAAKTVGFPITDFLIDPQHNQGMWFSLWTPGQDALATIGSITVSVKRGDVTSSKTVANPVAGTQY